MIVHAHFLDMLFLKIKLLGNFDPIFEETKETKDAHLITFEYKPNSLKHYQECRLARFPQSPSRLTAALCGPQHHQQRACTPGVPLPAHALHALPSAGLPAQHALQLLSWPPGLPAQPRLYQHSMALCAWGRVKTWSTFRVHCQAWCRLLQCMQRNRH